MPSRTAARPVFSVEVFPPKTEVGAATLRAAYGRLAALGPHYISVTCGAGPAAGLRTCALVTELRALAPAIEVVPHVTGIASSSTGIRDLLAAYRGLDLRHLVALRGDIPPGLDVSAAELRYARDLVLLVRAETGSQFHIEVAGYPEFHPEAPSAEADLDHLKRKVDAGADGVLTQYFYNADAYARFVESCRGRGVTVPIVPGIMPIAGYERLVRFSDAAGVEIPRWLRKRLDGLASDPASLEDFGADVVTALCRRLLEEGAPGLHFYTMNRDEPTATIWRRLGLPYPEPAPAEALPRAVAART
jgi:methylenetetrahydrofolate reductase (NADPH)